MKYLFFIVLLFYAIPINAADIIYENRNEINEIYLSGKIESGDAETVQEIINKCKRDNNQDGRLILDGYGNDFLEGIEIGNVVFKNGWGTLIKEEGVCDSACALAFLGGRFFGTSIGWGTDRNLEFGATLGFTNINHPSARDATTTKKGRKELADKEKLLPLALYEYLVKLKINPEFGIAVLKLNSTEEIFINTPRYLKLLDICIINQISNVIEDLSAERAISASMEILRTVQPEGWEFNPKAEAMSAEEFKREILKMVILREQKEGDGDFPLASQIKKSINSDNIHSLYTVFDELNTLGVIPVSPGEEAKIIKISGLTNIHHYLSRTGYFFINGTGTPQINVDYFFIDSPEISWTITKGYFKRYGTVMYDLYEPDVRLWQSGGGN